MEEKEEVIQGFGCLPDETDLRDYRIAAAAVKAGYFPPTFECEKRMVVKTQRSVGSCVAHATSSILEYHYTGKNPLLSTNFIYGIRKKLFGSTGVGMHLRDACQIAAKYGDPELKYCRGNTEVDEVYAIAEQAFEDSMAMENAANYKIKSYARLQSPNDIKFALTHYGPVLASAKWYIENECDEDGVLMMGDTLEAYHAFTIYGWNEIGWLCQNSWGKFWGNGGYFILPYEYGIVDSYSLVPKTANENDIKKPARSAFINKLYQFFNKILNVLFYIKD